MLKQLLKVLILALVPLLYNFLSKLGFPLEQVDLKELVVWILALILGGTVLNTKVSIKEFAGKLIGRFIK